MMSTFTQLQTGSIRLTTGELVSESGVGHSQFYRWQREGVRDRPARESKLLDEQTVRNAVALVVRYPHLGGRKAQSYMIYHRQGLLSMHAYDRIRGQVRRLINQEVTTRNLLPERTSYEHVRATTPGEIWAEDFTQLAVAGRTFIVALLIDVCSTFVLGMAWGWRASEKLVGLPVEQAVEFSGSGPEQFLVSDNGTVYISERHGNTLDALAIVQRRIPACTPQYNGSIEVINRDFKSVFYNVWEEKKRSADKEKSLDERIEVALKDTVARVNSELPRPRLGGVTPADVHNGHGQSRQQDNRQFTEEQRRLGRPPPWTAKYWDVLKQAAGISRLHDSELFTKFLFFCKRPLQKIRAIQLEAVG